MPADNEHIKLDITAVEVTYTLHSHPEIYSDYMLGNINRAITEKVYDACKESDIFNRTVVGYDQELLIWNKLMLFFHNKIDYRMFQLLFKCPGNEPVAKFTTVFREVPLSELREDKENASV
jgi:hypothetical protein